MVQVGWYVHYHNLWAEPSDCWAVVTRVDRCEFLVRFCDGSKGAAYTDIEPPDGHCTLYAEPPDEFFAWQAKRALLEGADQ